MFLHVMLRLRTFDLAVFHLAVVSFILAVKCIKLRKIMVIVFEYNSYEIVIYIHRDYVFPIVYLYVI